MMHINEEGFPLNVDPEIVSAEEAPMGDKEIVMGVVIEGEARAYPDTRCGLRGESTDRIRWCLGRRNRWSSGALPRHHFTATTYLTREFCRI